VLRVKRSKLATAQARMKSRTLQAASGSGASVQPGSRVMSVAEVAEKMGCSPQTIRRRFQDERGVITLNRPARLHKKGYRSMRIPRVVFERVFKRWTT
jgi:transposase-like protein